MSSGNVSGYLKEMLIVPGHLFDALILHSDCCVQIEVELVNGRIPFSSDSSECLQRVWQTSSAHEF